MGQKESKNESVSNVRPELSTAAKDGLSGAVSSVVDPNTTKNITPKQTSSTLPAAPSASSPQKASAPSFHEQVLQVCGLPFDIWELLILDQLGDRTIFLAGMCSKSWQDITSNIRRYRADYLASPPLLHPTWFPDDSWSSRKKIQLSNIAINNMKIGNVNVMSLTHNADEELGADRNYLILKGANALQDGGELLMISYDVHNAPLGDGEEEQPARCCHTSVDISGFPSWIARPSYSVDDCENHLVGPYSYVREAKDYGGWRAGKIMLINQKVQQFAPLDDLKGLIRSSYRFNQKQLFLFNGSALEPLVAAAPQDDDATEENGYRVAHIFTQYISAPAVRVVHRHSLKAFYGPWLLLGDPYMLCHVRSGQKVILKKSDGQVYMINAHRLVEFHPQSGKIKYAQLKDDGSSTEAEILSQLKKNTFQISPMPKGSSITIGCVCGRMVVLQHETVGSSSSSSLELIFVDLGPNGASILGRIQSSSGFDRILGVKAIDSTLFMILRAHNVDLLDLLARMQDDDTALEQEEEEEEEEEEASSRKPTVEAYYVLKRAGKGEQLQKERKFGLRWLPADSGDSS